MVPERRTDGRAPRWRGRERRSQVNPPADPSQLKSLGKFQVIEEIGRGGYGVVFKGYDPLIKRFVALKTCISDDSEVRRRFYREAEISGRLDHPNVVRIFDCGVEGDTPYLVQEYLEGEDLDVKIETGFLPFPERLLYLIQVARGLAYAHAQGVIHRDVKPSNIRVLDDGTAKIMDFGIAKLKEMDRTLTRAELTLGTAAYLAPEQIEGDPVDHRTDLFAFGIVAYELLTGHLPFNGEKLSALFYQTLHQQPRAVRSYSPACPVELERLVERCLEKRPERRIAAAEELLERLELVRDALRQESRLAPSARTQELPVSAATVPLQRADHLPEAPLDLLQLRQTPSPRQALGRVATRPPRRLARTLTLTAVLIAAVTAAVWSEAPAGLDSWLESRWEESLLATVGPAEEESLPPVAESVAPGKASGEPSDPAARTEAPPGSPTPELTVEPPVEPVEEVAPAPTVGVLSFPAGWSPRIRVSIDGSPPGPLGTSHEVAPGAHQVTFSLELPGYRASRTLRVKVAAGDWKRVDLPLRPPGRLSIQAALGAPQTIVAIDGERPRQTPVHARMVASGQHRIAVFDRLGSTTPQLEASVYVRSGEETIVTFDPQRSDPLVRRRALRRPSRTP